MQHSTQYSMDMTTTYSSSSPYIHRVQQSQRHNKMGISNLATIFGLTLMGNDIPSITPANVQAEATKLAETQWQVRIVQTILDNYRVIFEPDDE
jgi:mannose/fructose/N-acetylgalactosamine-specific phosphotransferase system component IID